MGATPSQHLSNGDGVQWPLQDDMGVVIALPSPPPLRQQGSPIARPATDYLGRRILAIQSGSPAAASGLVPWLDYVVGVNGRLYVSEDADHGMAAGLEPNVRVKLHVYNAKTQSVRDCTIVPILRDNQLYLGLKVSLLHTPDGDCLDKIVRVTGLARRSPASEAGLEPQVDYLLGSPEYGSFATLDDLEFALTEKEGKVFVYNSERDDIRLTSIRPRLGWSEEGGLLGAELANGILHRLPANCRRTCGKDRLTASEFGLLRNETVRTPEGVGELVQTLPDGSSLVRLDWGFGPDVHITGTFAAKNVEVLGRSN